MFYFIFIVPVEYGSVSMKPSVVSIIMAHTISKLYHKISFIRMSISFFQCFLIFFHYLQRIIRMDNIGKKYYTLLHNIFSLISQKLFKTFTYENIFACSDII